jgi:uncharacterized membrane protein YoaK (UPF0700 family)
MGIQNSTVTRLSNYDIRATHMTGVITDLGIEFGKWISDPVSMNRSKFKLLIIMIGSFFIGGIVGASLFKSDFGLSSLFGYAGILIVLAAFPVYKDIHIRIRYQKMLGKRG